MKSWPKRLAVALLLSPLVVTLPTRHAHAYYECELECSNYGRDPALTCNPPRDESDECKRCEAEADERREKEAQQRATFADSGSGE